LVTAIVRGQKLSTDTEEDSLVAKIPDLIAINHDDYHAEHVGRTADGRQFFLTTPFVPASYVGANDGNEFVALYLFDEAGKLLDAIIDEFGPRATLNKEELDRTYEQRLQEMGDVTFERIEVAPFAVERFGTTFGLIPLEPEDGEDFWYVNVEPDNYMAFSEPWDSGDYDT
jgi:hypothetical protein